MRTLGDVVDRLIITHLKLWHVQDKVHRAEEAGTGLDAETTHQVSVLNKQRNKLLTELEEVFAASVASGKAEVEHRFKF